MLHKFVNCNVIINSIQIDNPNSYLLALHVHWLLVRGRQYAGPVRPLLRNMGLYFMCAIGVGRNFRPAPSLYDRKPAEVFLLHYALENHDLKFRPGCLVRNWCKPEFPAYANCAHKVPAGILGLSQGVHALLCFLHIPPTRCNLVNCYYRMTSLQKGLS